ncbi:hypothetical protein M407DRAFT_143785 [Tulasnella calospora MUT 4182]|uniref:Uncharacterized protein n=1 Tax=Tulasnella calospora MUT 4182 TaxID=1051891 RepID=A0A0C3QQR8_9AGAM|nr:hypothetical protein M407DRAFT_143785 [Tulasnella calospora MUT 4182]
MIISLFSSQPQHLRLFLLVGRPSHLHTIACFHRTLHTVPFLGIFLPEINMTVGRTDFGSPQRRPSIELYAGSSPLGTHSPQLAKSRRVRRICSVAR